MFLSPICTGNFVVIIRELNKTQCLEHYRGIISNYSMNKSLKSGRIHIKIVWTKIRSSVESDLTGRSDHKSLTGQLMAGSYMPQACTSIVKGLKPALSIVRGLYGILPCIMRALFEPVFEGKVRMCIIHGWYLKYLVFVLVFCNYLLRKTSCTIICSKINAKIPLSYKKQVSKSK